MPTGGLADADCIIVQGSNMAENHPVAFRWVMKAKENGAKLIHVDPRFTRTSAVADIYAPIRTGSDIAFLGGLIRYVIENNKYFQEYVLNYTNAPTIVNDEFQDTEDLDGVFSGLMQYTGDPINGFVAQYDSRSWQYRGGAAADQGRSANTAQTGDQTVRSGQAGQPAVPAGQSDGRCAGHAADRAIRRARSLAAPAAPRDRSDPAESAVRLPDRPAALRAVHARDG
jgi:formate dehydrogenase major subunit